ncbi:MAG TPA: hypothetical protein VHR41_01670 [Gemmatimonadales bacterium]|jgi:hypothetical protein|nr:hypothetical protein [Gemmatimonadales bacterium]
MLKPGPVRPFFRLLGWVVGPLLLAAGALLVLLDLRGVFAAGWPPWSRRIHPGLWLGLGNLALGWIVLRGARTGSDPYVIPDESDASERDQSRR